MATMIIYDIAIKHKVINNLEKRGGGVVFTTDRPLGTYIIIHVCAHKTALSLLQLK